MSNLPLPSDGRGHTLPPFVAKSPIGMSEYRVQFEVFEGPLDLLLHLVKKQEVDIYQVNLTRIATEFVAYLEQMRELDLEVAGEFLVMAATLIYIKSRELLPVEKKVRPEGDDTDEDDPRWELIRRLVEYRKFKDAAAQLQSREGEMEGVYERRPSRIDFGELPATRAAGVSVFELVGAVREILKRFQEVTPQQEVAGERWTVTEKMESLRGLITERGRLKFGELFAAAQSRTEVVCIFLALLELTRMRVLSLAQEGEFSEIEVLAEPVELVPPPPSAPAPDVYGHPEANPLAAAADEPNIA